MIERKKLSRLSSHLHTHRTFPSLWKGVSGRTTLEETSLFATMVLKCSKMQEYIADYREREQNRETRKRRHSLKE